jgi:hypothetical protein
MTHLRKKIEEKKSYDQENQEKILGNNVTRVIFDPIYVGIGLN